MQGLLVCGLPLAAIFFAGCSSADKSRIFRHTRPDDHRRMDQTQPATIRPGSRRFHVGDTVTVNFSGLPEPRIDPHTEPIKEDGTITMPDIGHVQAVGKTAGELQNEIHDLYVPKLYLRLTVTVSTWRPRLLCSWRSQ
jgi:hypothetical protein